MRASDTVEAPTGAASLMAESSEPKRRGEGESRSADRQETSTHAEPESATQTQSSKSGPAESGPAKREARDTAQRAGKEGSSKPQTGSSQIVKSPQTQQRTPSGESARTTTSAEAKSGSNSGGRGEVAGRDVNGIQPSVYTGRYYRPEYETFRRCVVHRESRGDYTVRNSSSGASGAYQFMLSTSNEVARMMSRPDLIGRPAGTWTRAEQDEAFYTLYNHGRGASHWGGSCR